MPIVVQLPCPVRCRQSKSGKKILSSELLWIFDQQHVQRGTACSVVEYVEQLIDCDVKNERQVLRTPRIWHPKNREFFFAWMWSNTADAIMFVIWCHTTQLEGVNFYYVKGQLTRRLDVWSKLIENDWLKKDEQAPAGNQLTIGHFIYHLLYWSKCSLPRMQGQELWKSVAVQGGRTKRDTWDDTWRNCGRVSEYRF